MKWRCTWCGKPHAENDPPCDNCGHGEYEKAVVPAAPEGDEQTGDAYGHVWVCTDCGNEHPKNTPPCDRCGHTNFERQEISFDEDEVVQEMLEESTGRQMPSADVSYLDVLDAKLVLGFVGVAALVVIFALGTLGIVDVPGFGPGDPEPITAPGNATTVGALSIAEVEREYVALVNDRRSSELALDSNLDSAASYLNKKRVQAAYGADTTPSSEEFRRRIGDACSETPTLVRYEVATGALPDGSLGGFDSERAAAEALLARRDASVEGGSVTGVDVHVGPDGRVFVTQLTCGN